MYIPKPVNLDNIQLPKGLNDLVEELAEHNHDTWATQRIKDGWTYGKTRSDEKKEHPCLIPYDKLPESEKEYDRATSIGAIKLIVAMGYTFNR